MQSISKRWIIVPLVLAFAGGAVLAGLMPRVQAQATPSSLPPIFDVGARLMGPAGPVEVHEIAGDWIRVKSMSPLAVPDKELWVHVTSMAGAWSVNTEVIDKKMK